MSEQASGPVFNIAPSKYLDSLTGRDRTFGALSKTYSERESTYKAGVSEIVKLVTMIKNRHRHDAKLRIAHIDGRVKTLPSIIRKAVDKGIAADKVFDEFGDILGVRVVVNNPGDVAPLLEQLKATDGLSLGDPEEHSAPDGYRATHVPAKLTLKFEDTEHELACEIQIRTVFQDAWAILAHRDFYKNTAELPHLAASIAKHLSRALGALDHVAQDLRNELQMLVKPPNSLTDEAPLDREGIAFLYYERFGECPQEYQVHYLVRQAQEYGVKTVGEAEPSLTEEIFEKLRTVHAERFWIDISNDDLFEYALLHAVQGDFAFTEYRRKVERDWDEVTAEARAEILSELPSTFEELVEMLEREQLPWDALRELGAIQDCCICGNDILVPDAAEEALLEHYGNPDTDYPLSSKVFELGSDVAESVDFSGACQWCGHMMGKED